MYHYEFITIPNQEYDVKYENGRTRFFKLKTLIHKLICVKDNSQPASITDDNEAVAMKKVCDANGSNKYTNKKKKDVGNILLAEMCPYYYFNFIKLKVFHVKQKETPKMVKISASTNKLSQVFTVNVYRIMTYNATRRKC